jgi:hypothetical protein
MQQHSLHVRATQRAWPIYLASNCTVDPCDGRRCTLDRFSSPELAKRRDRSRGANLLGIVLPVPLTRAGDYAGPMVMARRLLCRILHDVVTHSAQPTLALSALSVHIAGCLSLE